MRAFIAIACLALAGSAWAQKSADECREEVGQRATQELTQRAVMACLQGEPVAAGESAPAGPDWSAIRVDNAGAVRFIRANAGRYKSEVPAVGTPMRIRVHLDGSVIGVYSMYDGQRLTFNALSLREFKLQESCRGTGTYVGQNAFGAKVQVHARTCEVVQIESPDIPGPQLRGVTDMSPAQYRAMAARGADLEVDYVVTAGFDGKVAYRQQLHDTATISNPVDDRTTLWSSYGDVQRVRLLAAPGVVLDVYTK